ncbi:MAG TPA: ankyrin repeat domain-containing protein [Actinomadura sp.]|jgi:ankyrin repeat protein|nr:ankyrin repeat domain-containing protein [Actinomadura sp.]
MPGSHDLYAAAALNEVDRLRELLAQGADPNQTDEDGFTPLHLACQEWSVDAVRELLAAGAAVDAATEGGYTPLILASFRAAGRDEVIELLRLAGADLSRADVHGHTPLDIARLTRDYSLEWKLICAATEEWN